MRKLNPIPELAHLAEAQLETLDGWLSEHPYAKVAQLVAAPAPEGFGLKIGRDKLRRHYHRQQALAQFEDQRDLLGEIEALNLGLQSGRIEALCLDIIIRKAFDLLLEPGHTAQTLNTLLRIATYRQTRETAERRLRLAEQQAAFNATQPPAPARESADIPVRQVAQTAPTAPASRSAPSSVAPSVPSASSASKIIRHAAELVPQLTLDHDWRTNHPAFAPLPVAAPSPRQAAEFRALAKAAGLTLPQLTDLVAGLIENDAPAPASNPAKPL